MKKAIIALWLVLFAGPVRAELITETVEYHHGDRDLLGYVAYDDALSGKLPGVLVVHEWTGPRPFMQAQAERLARLGYLGFVSNIYSAELGEVPRATADFVRNRVLLQERATAALAALQRQPRLDPTRVAVVGFGFGGNTALDLAGGGTPLAGVVSVHGALDAKLLGGGENLHARVLALQGAADRKGAPAQVQAFQQAIGSADWQLVLYGGAGNAFANPEAASYNAEADRRAWAAIDLFFSEIFGKK